MRPHVRVRVGVQVLEIVDAILTDRVLPSDDRVEVGFGEAALVVRTGLRFAVGQGFQCQFALLEIGNAINHRGTVFFDALPRAGIVERDQIDAGLKARAFFRHDGAVDADGVLWFEHRHKEPLVG